MTDTEPQDILIPSAPDADLVLPDETPMPADLVAQARELGYQFDPFHQLWECDECGSMVKSVEKHSEWHAWVLGKITVPRP